MTEQDLAQKNRRYLPSVALDTCQNANKKRLKWADSSSVGLHRDLKQRHIRLIGLGTCIGVGLFLGSSSAIKLAGPAVMIAYLIAGILSTSSCVPSVKCVFTTLLRALSVDTRMTTLGLWLVL